MIAPLFDVPESVPIAVGSRVELRGGSLGVVVAKSDHSAPDAPVWLVKLPSGAVVRSTAAHMRALS